MEEVNLAPLIGDIRKEWHWVRPIVEELLNDNPHCGTIPEDVYHECKAGNAHLWVSPHYLVITQFEYDVHSGDKTLYIWFAWSRDKGANFGLTVMDYMEQFAKNNGCKTISFGTRYQPLIDYLCSDMGFRVTSQNLTRDVE
jgi:hypothetical protein